MKAPISVKELVWKYNSLSQADKVLFGSDSVLPASDVIDALSVAERSMRINSGIAEQCSFLLKFLIDNESKFESHDFRVLITRVQLSLDRLSAETNLLHSKFDEVSK